MTLAAKTLLETLDQNPEKGLEIKLPTGETIPAHFHITELGYVEKHFMDCGGVKRQQNHLQIQIWVANDYDHRVDAAKWLQIFELSQPILPELPITENLEVWLEYQTDLTSQYPLQSITVEGDKIQLQTGLLETQCLAVQKLESSCCNTSSCCQ